MGKTRQGKQKLNSYNIRGTGEDVKVGDCVLFKPFKLDEPPYVAAVVERLKSREVKVQWYYRPEDTISYGREHYHGSKELFISDHYDIQSVDNIIGKCIVHPLKNYINLDKVGNKDYCTRYKYNIVDTENLTLDVDAIDRFCICDTCRLPYNPDKVRVQCYHCKLRFHPACVKTATYVAWKLCYHHCDTCFAERERRNSPGQERAVEERLLRIVAEHRRR
ncbi:Chromatin remodeling protein like [Heracleum sosnowskyi]|uniref:Chromatin remodeling protein like n=1 Tax=Heracleum sosnowskyi TaxID=360622 RepID=A0AAD8NCV2_9APIA|nr:Chromatin remodeling protein like [Heracleum sosnowskyi]